MSVAELVAWFGNFHNAIVSVVCAVEELVSKAFLIDPIWYTNTKGNLFCNWAVAKEMAVEMSVVG